MNSIDIRYRLSLPEGRSEEFDVRLNAETMTPAQPRPSEVPSWVRLDYHQCSNCPWTVDEHPDCPLALSLLPVVGRLAGLPSYAETRVEVHTEQRTVCADTLAQEAVSSLIGLLIATSGCPHTTFLKPMARFHLPLASPDETVYRVVSMYALSRYFLDGVQDLDRSFSGLLQRYEAMRQVNQAIAERLRFAGEEDSTLNAIILLDLLAQALPVSIEDSLDELKTSFQGLMDA